MQLWNAGITASETDYLVDMNKQFLNLKMFTLDIEETADNLTFLVENEKKSLLEIIENSETLGTISSFKVKLSGLKTRTFTISKKKVTFNKRDCIMI